jgi:hypothetical protein
MQERTGGARRDRVIRLEDAGDALLCNTPTIINKVQSSEVFQRAEPHDLIIN